MNVFALGTPDEIAAELRTLGYTVIAPDDDDDPYTDGFRDGWEAARDELDELDDEPPRRAIVDVVVSL